MKAVVLALLVGSLIAISPSVAGQHYADTLHNNLSVQMKNYEAEAEQFTTQPVIVGLAESQVMRLAKMHMGEEFENAKTVLKKVVDMAKAGESFHTYHAFFVAMDYKNEQARTYEVTLVRKDTSLVAAINKKTHEIEKKQKWSFYYEIYSSGFGLSFIFHEKAPIFDTELTEDMINYMRQYLLRSAELRRGSMVDNTLGGFMDWVNGASGAIKSLTEAAQGIIAVFKSINTTTLKEHVKGEGFKAYKAMSNYSRILGVPLDKYDRFLKSFKVQMGLNRSKRIEEMNAYFEIAEFAANEWKVNDFVFGVGRTDNICNNLVITNQIDYKDNVVHFVSVNVEGSFELADDTLVYTQYKSVFGGISESTKEIRKSLPRDIKDEEIKAINALMVLNAINVYAENMNIKFQLPNDNPWKM